MSTRNAPPRRAVPCRRSLVAVALTAGLCALAACTEDLPDPVPASDAGADALTDASPRRDAGDAEPQIEDAEPADQRPTEDAEVCVSKGQELCGNGQDDDCDGQFDEVPEGVGEACREGLGACARTGIITCDDTDGQYRCSVTAAPPAPAELCNGVDDDCDGATDEDTGLGDACVVAFAAGCEVPGTQICDPVGDGTTLLCSAPNADPDGDGFACDDDCDPNDGTVNPGAAETCNLVDEDCDGLVDEGLDCPCEPRQRGGRTYLFCEGTVTQATATEVCAPYGQVPVEIGHPLEQGFVTRQTTTIDIGLSWWLGLRAAVRGGPFLWASGAPLDFTFWFGGGADPFGRMPGQDCAVLSQGASWVPVDCLLRYSVVCEPPCAVGTDFDGDGFEGCAQDCDDTQGSVRPGGVETCGDAIDNDCDGQVDERCL